MATDDNVPFGIFFPSNHSKIGGSVLSLRHNLGGINSVIRGRDVKDGWQLLFWGKDACVTLTRKEYTFC